MDFKNIFTEEVSQEMIDRIRQLQADKQAKWGKMNVAQMLAHVNVAYELVFEPEKYPKPNFLMQKFIQLLAKPVVVGTKPYKRNTRTAPIFVISDTRDFEKEQNRLIRYIEETQKLGEDHFDGKESHSFGKLSKNEWNTLFYKHLDHHLSQFGV
ncbi:DUF1569 domain-containing protein [Marinilongibacter aquaticus]|uniref:DUF1569 domain-containing protein n=1 Tax=Marinilongibacter aquaticus TaxID=2975157 RepID=UPI0021BD3C51|nr:DUF1569 domain-containing protein [Marinilongibacter aquaticus]UBM58999.1 DUF1569 domain-containing protein [Marinilongibacter aquaticus]